LNKPLYKGCRHKLLVEIRELEIHYSKYDNVKNWTARNHRKQNTIGGGAAVKQRTAYKINQR
jgi:hypothetical protein